MGVNTVETSDGRTIMDISGTEATPGTVMKEVGFYDANGEWRTGELMPVLYSPQTLTEEEQRQARENIGVPEVEDITRLTSLPASGTTLTANAEYRVSAAVGTYQFAFPESGDVYVRFTTAATFAISFASGTTYLGAVPKFEAGKTYELMARDGIAALGEVIAQKKIRYVDYIESTGGHFLDTRFKPNQDTRILAEVSFETKTDSTYLFGAREESAKNVFSFQSIDGKYKTRYNNSEKEFTTPSINGKFTIDCNKNVDTINNDEVIEYTYGTFECPVSLYIYGCNNNGTLYAPASEKIHSFKMFDNGKLIRYYRPCLDDYDAACFWDEANEEYVYGSGDGSFIAGEVIDA